MQRFLSPTLLALLGLFTTSGWAQQPVFVEPLRSESTQATERLLGSLRARSTSVMAALEEGVLLGMDVREGRTVAQGDVLAVLDARRLTAERAKKQADLAMGSATLLEREARLSNSELDLRALEQAASTGAISDQDLRNAKTQVAIDRAQLEAAKQANQAAQAELDLLDIRIQDCVVRAPFAARIIARHAEVGQWVHQGDPLVTLISTGPLEAWLQVPERFMGQIGETPMTVRLEATQATVLGQRPRIIPMVDERARTFPLLLDVTPSADQVANMHAGMSISAEVPIGTRQDHLVISSDAILRRGESALVVKVAEGNVAALVPVKILFSTPGGFALEAMVPGDLQTGDQLVVEGNERVYPGTPLVPSERGAQAPTGETPTPPSEPAQEQ